MTDHNNNNNDNNNNDNKSVLQENQEKMREFLEEEEKDPGDLRDTVEQKQENQSLQDSSIMLDQNNAMKPTVANRKQPGQDV